MGPSVLDSYIKVGPGPTVVGWLKTNEDKGPPHDTKRPSGHVCICGRRRGNIFEENSEIKLRSFGPDGNWGCLVDVPRGREDRLSHYCHYINNSGPRPDFRNLQKS